MYIVKTKNARPRQTSFSTGARHVLANEGTNVVDGLPCFGQVRREHVPAVPHSRPDNESHIYARASCRVSKSHRVAEQDLISSDMNQEGW
jgi:hypothetical protein